MRKTLTALVTATTVAVAAVANPTAADAHHFGWGPGLFGGLVAGALIGSAFAPRYYNYSPGYYSYYDGPGPYYGCWRRAWNGWGYVRYRVC